MNMGYALMGNNPTQTVINIEIEKLRDYLARPAAIAFSFSVSFFGSIIPNISISPTYIFKGSDKGFHLFATTSFGLNIDNGSGADAGLMVYWLKGDERNFKTESFLGASKDLSIGYKYVNLDYSTFNTEEGDRIDGYGLSLSSKRYGPAKLAKMNGSLGIKKSLTIDVMNSYKKKMNQRKDQIIHQLICTIYKDTPIYQQKRMVFII